MYLTRRPLAATAFVCLVFTVNVKAQVSSENLLGMSSELQEMTEVSEQLSTRLQGMSERMQALAEKVESNWGNRDSEDQNSKDLFIDLALGEAIYKMTCTNCHGSSAQGVASFPELTGQSAEYLTMRLEQYRAGEKLGPSTGLMKANAVNLSDEEIGSISQYIVESFN